LIHAAFNALYEDARLTVTTERLSLAGFAGAFLQDPLSALIEAWSLKGFLRQPAE
jgi:hypothetical protein